MLPVFALGVLLSAGTLESQACRTVKQGLFDNEIECPLFAHEVVSGEVQGVKERAVMLIARMRGGTVMIMAVGGHNGARYFWPLGAWAGHVPTSLAVVPAGAFEIVSPTLGDAPQRVETIWDVLVATFSDGSRRMLKSDGRTWVQIRSRDAGARGPI